MLRMLIALIVSAAVVLAMGPRFIPVLRKMKFGQTIYELGPQSHKTKQGTPTMGGLMIAAGAVAAAVVCQIGTPGWGFMLPLILVAALSMAVGFADDYIKVVKKRSLGLTPWQKIFGQVFVCVSFSTYCYLHPQVGSSIIIPFVNVEWDLGLFYIPLLSLTILFMINSANLQDGLDGILSSVEAVGSLAWAGIALMFALAVAPTDAAWAANLQAVAIFGMAMCGACIGFLRFNHYPATVFMGDTG
ncbi:MAG: phospho-N-acetylmuramoyl-pentapeptide-transferase, partial [Aristaeellaceae bacterium]